MELSFKEMRKASLGTRNELNKLLQLIPSEAGQAILNALAAGTLTLDSILDSETRKAVSATQLAAIELLVASLTPTSVNVAGPYSVLASDHTLNVFRTSVGTCSIQLPAIASIADGRRLKINDAGYLAAVNNITLIPSGTDRIDNVAANYVVSVSGASLELMATTNPNTGIKNWQVM